MGKKIINYGSLDVSPLGRVWAASSKDGLWTISFGITEEAFISKTKRKSEIELVNNREIGEEALIQVEQYLAGKLNDFDLDIDWAEMTDFQIAILKATIAVPAGSTTTYGALAKAVGSPGGARAVGRVQATNPIPLVIPCHRVLNSSGKLHGYSSTGGLDTKSWLLELEGAVFQPQLPNP